MKQLVKRGFAWLLVLIMVIGLLPTVSFAAEQGLVDYQYGSWGNYDSVIKNWGIRGELATFLSPNAEAFYSGTSLSELLALEGSSDTDTVATSSLYVKLHDLMASAQTKTTSYDDVRDLFQFTDIQNNGIETSQISCIYSGTTVGPDWDNGATWNREHTWPNSKGGDGKHESDIMMLRPESASNNSSRNNKAYGESEGYYSPNISSNYDVRGDVARIMLYQYVRWGGETTTAEDGTVSFSIPELHSNLWGESGVIESLDVLLKWMEEDPVDTWEMARNDSVQSITGTRNVFVDFPELAFALFDREVTGTDYVTPSGVSTANINATPDFTITVDTVNPEYGTCIVNGKYVAAVPAHGCQVASITADNGTVSASNRVLTVSAESGAEVTVHVTFAKMESYTVNVVENGKTVVSKTVVDGDSFALPAFSGTLPDGYAFLGWVTGQTADSASKPTVIQAAGTEMSIDDDVTYYALLTHLNADDQSGAALSYELVDSEDDLVIGDKYVIAAEGNGIVYALSKTQATNNRKSAEITKNGNTLVFDSDANVAELELQEGTPVTEPEPTEPPATTEPVETEPVETEPGETSTYVYKKVTEEPADWSGEYLIVYEAGSLIFNGSMTALGGGDNYLSATITDGMISAEDGEAYKFTIAATSAGYSIQAASGKYIGHGKNENKLTPSDSPMDNTISMNTDGSVNIICSGGAYLRYNSTSKLFRYYKSSTYTNQKAIALYKKTAVTEAKTLRAETAATETKTYAFYDAANSGYLYAAGGDNSNWLRTQETIDANASFTITVNTDGTCTLLSTGGGSKNNLQLVNVNYNLFSCYSTKQTAVSLYHGIGTGGTYYYTTTWESTDPVDPTEPETTEPETTEPETTEPEATEPETTLPPADSELTIAEAIALGESLEKGTYTENKYYITGTVESIANATYGNLTVKDDTGSLYIFGLYSADGVTRYDALETKPVTGDTVKLYGVIGNYNGTAQMKNGWLTEHTANAPTVVEPEGDTLTIEEANALGNQMVQGQYTSKKYNVTGVIKSIENTQYGNMTIMDESGNTLTVYGSYDATGENRYDAMETKPVKGDTVTVYGVIGKYNAPQMLNGWIVAHTPAVVDPDAPTVSYAGTYFIAAKRTEGNYWYMTSDLGTAKTKRYTAVDSGLTELPASVTEQTGYVFTLIDNGDGTYKIRAEGVEGDCYLGWSSSNSGTLVAEADAKNVTVEKLDTGAFEFTFVDTSSQVRYLALNGSTGNYFAWYKSGQAQNLYLIPAEEAASPVTEWSLTLGGELAVNFSLIDMLDTDTLTITVNGVAVTPEKTGNLATVYVAAAQLNDIIHVSILRDGTVLAEEDYTVRQYCDTILGDETKSAYHALVKELLHYGATAQTLFQHNGDNLADSGITGTAQTEIPTEIDPIAQSGSVSGIRFYGASLIHRDKLAVRFYFTGDVSGCVFTVDEQTYEPVIGDGLSYIEITGILPQNLDEQITVTLTSGEDVLTVTYGPMNYIARMSAKGSAEVQALVKALYNYHLAAKSLIAAEQ